ncbi:Fructosamine kinase-domain-containing protein [Rhypophila decipiens]|uniref:protein-ribulosamine 3-kinase n=1 Tax=Rhypophila decipiens TaxID=261697 RepID=A0AAN6Y8N6_9PEZI|nr:Fructosamine kinase-domain-containing protein [Rhypophila decipiens]
MVCIDPGFVVPGIPENEKYEGTEVDANVRKALPEGTTIKWAKTFVASFWAMSSKIDAVLPSGEEQSYFLKVHNPGLISTRELLSVIPNNVPQVVAHGPCASKPGRAFFLAEFRDMRDELPSASDLVSVVAAIHTKTSPNGKFGYPVTTFSGKHPMDTRWCDTWEEYFRRCMKDTMEAELATQGPNLELQELSGKILTKVVPRLIRPMETGGRKITPVLVHGDLWHGNVSVDEKTKVPVLYDPCCFYGHNEYDFSMWRATRYLTSREHVDEYFKTNDRSEPQEDQDDRHALYALRSDLAVSVLWPENKDMRELAIQEMQRLVAKYGDGYEGYIAAQGKLNAAEADGVGN